MKEIFCGREAELRWLEDKYKRAMSGEFSVIFVSGEAGSGKTFLIEEFLRRKEEEDEEIVVAIGRCSDLNQKVPDPYAPFKQIGYFISGKSEKAGVYVLSQYSRERVEKINKKVLEIAEEVGGEILGALIPPLQVVKMGWNIFKILRGRERVEKSEDSIRVAYTLFLKRLTQIKPIVLFIDDLHWADDGSINLLFHLARNMDKDRLTIFVAYREEELSEEGRRCVSELSGRYGCPVLRFGREGWEEFVKEYLEKNYPDIRIKGDALKELIDRTQGNPFFLSQIMLELKDKGLIKDGEIDMGDMRRVPERVGDFLYERYQRLEEDLKKILRVGSVEGDEFTLQVVSRVLSMPEERLVEVIGERLIRGYGFLDEAGEKRLKRILELYRFRHAYLRDTIYERGLTESEKRRLHRLVGEALEAVVGEDNIDFLPQLYQHFLIAGMPDKVIDYALKLIPMYNYMGLYWVVLVLVEDALKLWEGSEEKSAEKFMEINVWKALALYSLGYYKESKEIYEEVMRWQIENLGEEHPDVATILNNIGNVYNILGEYDKALEYHNKSLEMSKKILGEEHPDVAASLNNIGNVYYNLREYNKALEYYEKSLEIRKKILGEEHPDVALSLNNIGLVYYSLGEYAKALDYYEKSLEIRKRILGEEHPYVALSLYGIGMVYLELNDIERSIEFLSRAIGILSKKYGERHPDTAVYKINYARAIAHKGEYKNALQILNDSEEILIESLGENHTDVAECYWVRGEVFLLMGDKEGAKSEFLKSYRIMKDKPDKPYFLPKLMKRLEELGIKE